jgi:hypothetical protein
VVKLFCNESRYFSVFYVLFVIPLILISFTYVDVVLYCIELLVK